MNLLENNGNGVCMAPPGEVHGIVALEHMDNLPPLLRHILHHTVVDFCAYDVWEQWQKAAFDVALTHRTVTWDDALALAAVVVAKRLLQDTAIEIGYFALDYEMKHNLPYPHTEAKATPLGLEKYFKKS